MVRISLVLIATAIVLPPPVAASDAKGTCSRGDVEVLVRRVLSAFNRGDVAAFNRLIAQRPAFKWFSVGGEPGRRIQSAAFDRAGLPRYVTARHRQRERQQLMTFGYNGRSGGYAHFDFSVIRSARDHPSERVVGKGAVACSLRPARVAVWSLGDA
jgi:hypothetical protein